MAKCKSCNVDIPDGNDLCEKCLSDKRTEKDEAYLDGLLNSVINTTPSANNDKMIGTNKLNIEIDNDNWNTSSDNLISNGFDGVFSDVVDIELSDIDPKDLEDFTEYSSLEDFSDNIIITDEDLYTESYYEPEQIVASNIQNRQDEYILDHSNKEDDKLHLGKKEDSMEEQNKSTLDTLNILEDGYDLSQTNVLPDEINDYDMEEFEDNSLLSLLDELDHNETLPIPTIEKEEITNETEDIVDKTDDIADGITTNKSIDNEMLDESSYDILEEKETDANLLETVEEETWSDSSSYDNYEYQSNEAINDNLEDEVFEDDDFLSLLKQLSDDDPVMDDVQAISDMLNGVEHKEDRKKSQLTDVGEVFSDALSVVSSLDDEAFIQNIEEFIPEVKDANNKLSVGKASSGSKGIKGFLKKLFGNVSSKEENEPIVNKSDTMSMTELSATNDKDVVDNKKSKKNKIDKKKSTDKKISKKELKRLQRKVEDVEQGSPEQKTNDRDDNSDSTVDNKKGKKIKQQKEKQQIPKKKNEAKQQKVKKQKEVAKDIQEIVEDEGRISRLGAAIIFIFFGLIVIFLLAGTDKFNYSVSIRNATNYFNSRRYTQAYFEIVGIDLKDEDKILNEKIMTVMFVNKQLNSYNNFYAMKQYPQALDSLLKGLSRYDKYIEMATILGIESDLNFVRMQILEELDKVFGISEEEALNIINSGSQTEYSLSIFDIVLERKLN